MPLKGMVMLTHRALIPIIVLSIILAGCAAMGVPETSDPDKKIEYSYILFDQQQRPLPAERLIREAITIYKEIDNDLGLAEAYRAYGFFFRSPSIKKWQKHYETNAFMENGATYANRYDKSIEFFEKAVDILKKHKEYDTLTNVYLNMGFTYEFANLPENACEQYKMSATSNQQYMVNNPGGRLSVPKGFSSFEAYVSAIRERLKCTE
jgi:tetratricopeptide (TPR) repeat protein